jgi:hypothetical protein
VNEEFDYLRDELIKRAAKSAADKKLEPASKEPIEKPAL